MASTKIDTRRLDVSILVHASSTYPGAGRRASRRCADPADAYGHAFVCYDIGGQHRALRHLMLHTEPMRSVVQALIDHDGQSLDATALLLQEMAPLAPSTARRRARTVVS